MSKTCVTHWLERKRTRGKTFFTIATFFELPDFQAGAPLTNLLKKQFRAESSKEYPTARARAFNRGLT